ncbi:MAG: monovalent cation:proton antiporter-2 (CPA2) family protein [Thiotrichaceae bacterium]
MQTDGFFYQAFIYLTAAVISVPIAKRFGLGSVLGYLIAGIAIGPFGMHLIGEEGQDVMHFAEFGVVMMLFLIGLELQPSLLWKLRAPILGLGGLQMGLTAGLITLIGLILGLNWKVALAVGLILALSSTALVLQTLNEKNLMRTDAGQNAFSVLLFQDIAVIPMLAILPLIASPLFNLHQVDHGSIHSGTWIDGIPFWGQTLVVIGVVAVIIIAGRYLTRPVFRFIAKTRLREMFTATALLLVIGITLLMTNVGLSPALGTFLAGVVLAGSEYRHELEGDIEPIKGLFLGLFFIAVGASIDFGLISDQPATIGGILAALIFIKLITLFFLGRIFKMGMENNLLFSFALAQGGEFAFVLFSFATQNSVIPNDLAAMLIVVVAISMALTPLILMTVEKLLLPRVGTREQEMREADDIDEENPVIIAGFGRFGNILGRLLSANGINATFLDLDADNVEILRKLGIKVYYGDASRLDLLHAAKAEKAKLIVLAIDNHQKIMEIIETVKKHFPHLTIMARASGRIEAYELLENGIKHVFRETFETSLRMGVEVMRQLGFHSYQTHRSARLFKRRDDEDLHELASIWYDRKAYLSSARKRIQDLERLLIKEQDGHDETRDMGWDTTTLRQDFANIVASVEDTS